MLESIGKLFGPTALQAVIAVTGLYYGLIAFARVKELFAGGDGARSAAARKTHLEALKLEAEIAVARKEAGLEPLSTQDLQPPAVTRPSPVLMRFVSSLWERGTLARILLGSLTIILQMFGWLAVGLLTLAARYWFTMRLKQPGFELKAIEGYVVLASFLLGGGSLYLGLVAIGRRLKPQMPRLYRLICTLVFGLMLTITIAGWRNQTSQLWPPNEPTSNEQ